MANSFGADTGDDTVGLKSREPSGADIDWGQDLEIKLKQDVETELAMEEQKERMLEEEDVDENSDELRVGTSIELCKKLQQRGAVFGQDLRRCAERASSVISDAVSTFWAATKASRATASATRRSSLCDTSTRRARCDRIA